MRLRTQLLLLALAFSGTWTANSNVLISTLPINGTGASLGPNVLLDLSVEYPTARTPYVAYTSQITSNYFVLENDDDYKKEFIGYFDPNKCYSYQTKDNVGYFRPDAAVIDPVYRSCAAGLWSGNILNFGTTSAIDIFRSAMTGGNRALGISGNISDYGAGDKTDFTSLRRTRASPALENFNKGPNAMFKHWPSGLFPAPPAGTVAVGFINSNWGFEMRLSRGNKPNGDPSWEPSPEKYNAIVQVCREIPHADNEPSLPRNGLEANCKAYPNGTETIYKPEGLIQQYGTQMRFGVFGYLLDNVKTRNGGVLRARMKYPAQGSTVKDENGLDIHLGAEWDTATGIYVNNPDQKDAQDSSVGNSGVVNYLNKFGDTNGYKQYDTAAEMFYASQRYFRKKKNYAKNTQGLTTAMKDNFPVITNWDDPLLGSCQKNFIIYIGDTNTWNDIGLPGLGDNAAGHPAPNDDNEFNTKDYLQKMSINEIDSYHSNYFLNNTFGVPSTKTPASIAALALWAHTKDIRPDSDPNRGMPGMQTIDTFMIDVLGIPKVGPPVGNTFYLAAKYGAFDTGVGALPPKGRDPSWTSDPAGYSRVPVYLDSGGTPDNFALAQDPESMVKALERAFSKVSVSSNITLASLSSNFESQPSIAGSYIFQSSFESENWTGDLITYELGFDTSGNITQTIKQHAKNDYGTQMATGWDSRSLFTLDQTSRKGVDFNTTWFNSLPTTSNAQRDALNLDAHGNVDGNGEKRVQFLRGDRDNEAAGSTPQFRERASLLGDIVNSRPEYIAKPIGDPHGCQYNSTNRANILARDSLVAVAVNDGLLHVFSTANGKEKFAYLPAAIFGKLPSLTDVNYQHNFYNDGSPVAQDMCFSRNPTSGSDYAAGAREGRTVLVGSTGVGGSAVYALDVTNKTITHDDVLWEFSANDDADMGLATSRPTMAYVRWHGGKTVPVAIFGNGPNSSGGFGALFILRLDKKKGDAWQENVNYIKTRVRPDLIAGTTAISASGLSTGLTWGTLPMTTTPNGLGGVTTVDHFGRGIADFAYAGDLNGNLWAFNLNGDLGNSTTPAAISTGLMFVAHTPGDSTATPVIPAVRQPITAAPLAVLDASSSCYDRVLIGTGQWYSNADNPIGQQTMYGLCTRQLPGVTDNTGAPPVMTVAKLNQQTLITDSTGTVGSNNGSTYHATSNNPVPNGESWYLNMLDNERVLQPPRERGNQVVRIDSVQPNTGQANCGGAGNSFITELNLFTGTLVPGALSPLFPTASRQQENVGVAGQSLVIGEWQFNKGELDAMPTVDKTHSFSTLGSRLSWRELVTN